MPSSLDACAAQPECAAISSEVAPAVTAPTAAGTGVTTISTTTATGTTTSFVQAAGATVVGDMRLSGLVGYYIWNQAQNKAKEINCL